MKRFFSATFLPCITAVLLLSACCNNALAELVTVWNELTLRAIRYENIPPPVAVRQTAIIHLAMYDAVNGIERNYKPYLVQASAPKECSLEASISAAAYHSLRTLFPKSADSFDSTLSCHSCGDSKWRPKDEWHRVGQTVASEFLKLRQFDSVGQTVAWA